VLEIFISWFVFGLQTLVLHLILENMNVTNKIMFVNKLKCPKFLPSILKYVGVRSGAVG
jgi:hypothetical protein